MLTLTYSLPGAPRRSLRVRRGDTSQRLAAFLRAFAQRRGVSPLALDWSVERVGV